MKKIIYTKNIRTWTKYKLLLVLIFMLGFSCNEKEFLKETPLDFYAPENSFVSFTDFEAAVFNLHVVYKSYMWGEKTPRNFWDDSDLSLSYYFLEGSQTAANNLGPTKTIKFWSFLYQLIYDANVIIGRVEGNNVVLNTDQKRIIQGEAYFFRGLAYKLLANCFGGVPIVLDETMAPKRDYTRATRQKVYEQSASDLEFAAANLKDITQTDDSRINKLAASHYLTEVYISLQRWQDAINESSKVIDNPATGLMISRFGTQKNDPGDVYSDLFRPGNQNRSTGNKEAIWVIQFAYNVPGGGDPSEFVLERNICPDLTKANIRQSNGKLVPILKYPNTYVCGRGQGFSAPSPYFQKELWEKSGFNQDIRNSSYNIIRDVQVRNPTNQYNGKWVIADKLPLVKNTAQDTARSFFPIIGKATTPGKHPAQFWLADQSIPGSLTTDAKRTWRDQYEIRLAETYLLRAEAYLGSGNLSKAAEDINVVRRRSNAPDVSSSQVNIDYILDEQLRELHYENLRLPTLLRLGKAVDRVKRLNPVVGKTMGDHQNLLAIPDSEIQKNTGAVLEQNPGY